MPSSFSSPASEHQSYGRSERLLPYGSEHVLLFPRSEISIIRSVEFGVAISEAVSAAPGAVWSLHGLLFSNDNNALGISDGVKCALVNDFKPVCR